MEKILIGAIFKVIDSIILVVTIKTAATLWGHSFAFILEPW